MTTPANRAPKFVVMDRNGSECGWFDAEEAALVQAAAFDRHYIDDVPHLVHPIGPALPAPAPVKSLGMVCADAFGKSLRGYPGNFADAASAVVAAHEARKGWEVTEKFAAYCSDDDTWWSQARGWAAKVHRTEYDTPGECPSLRSLDGCKIFRITRRRRVRAK